MPAPKQTVRTGVLHPLTGNAASAGNRAKMASEFDAFIVNNGDQALRRIAQEKVVAIVGSYQSGIPLTGSAVAERYGIPFLTPESPSADLAGSPRS